MLFVDVVKLIEKRIERECRRRRGRERGRGEKRRQINEAGRTIIRAKIKK